MTKTNKNIDYGAALQTMTDSEKVIDLTDQIIKNNYVLLELLNQMKTEDYNYYLPKVQAIIRGAKPPANGFDEAPTVFLYDKLNWPEDDKNDIPVELYSSPKN